MKEFESDFVETAVGDVMGQGFDESDALLIVKAKGEAALAVNEPYRNRFNQLADSFERGDIDQDTFDSLLEETISKQTIYMIRENRRQLDCAESVRENASRNLIALQKEKSK